MASVRQTIEDRVIAEISAAYLKSENPATGYLHAVAPYNGEFDGDDLDEIKRVLRGRTPAILVAASVATPVSESVGRRQFRRDLIIEIYLMSGHLRDRVSRNRSDVVATGDPNADPGAYQMIENIHELLATNDLGTEGVGYLVPSGREEPLIRIPDVTAWRMTFDVAVDANLAPWSYGDGQPLSTYSIKSNVSDVSTDESPNPVVTTEGSY